MGRVRSSGAALAVATGILLSRLSGLIRDRVFAYYLGSSHAAGAFRAALKIPNFLQNLFGEGVLSASFIPVYARLRAEGRDQEAVQVAGTVATLLALAVTILATIGTLVTPWIINLIAPGFSGEDRTLTVQLVQIMFPGVALLVLSAWCLGILNSHRRFLLPYMAPVLWNVGIIGALLLSAYVRPVTPDGQQVLARDVAWGTIVGCILQFGIQLPAALRLTRGIRPELAITSASVRAVLHNFLPVVTSRGVVQLSAYIDQILASFLGAPMVAALAYAQQLYLLPVSLFGMSISAAELPEMSSVSGSTAMVEQQIRLKIEAALRRVCFFVIPSVVALAALGDVVVATIFQTGQFKAEDVTNVWLILAGSTVGLLASTQGRLCSTAVYALRDARTPLRFALVRVVITAAAGYLFALPLRVAFGYSEALGAASLTATAGVAGWVEFLLLKRALSRRLGAFDLQLSFVAKLWLTAAVAAAAALLLKWSLPPLYPVVRGALVLGLYGIIYLGATITFQLGEGATLGRTLLKRWRG